MASPPRLFHDLHGLEQTIPPPRRTPSPALRDDAALHVPMPQPETFFRHASPSPSPSPPSLRSARSPPLGYSAWENRGHRSPPNSQHAAFPRSRSERSVSPRHNMRPEFASRARTPPALEPPAQLSRLSPNSCHDQRYLQPSNAELRRQRQEWQHRQEQGTRPTPPPKPHAVPTQPRVNTTPVRSNSVDTVSPLSASTTGTTPSPPFALHHSYTTPGQDNLAKIGAPKPRRSPRTAVPSMCEYLSLDELEGLWAQQDLFPSSVSVPQTQKPSVQQQLLRFPKVPAEDLGVHPAFRSKQGTLGLVQ